MNARIEELVGLITYEFLSYRMVQKKLYKRSWNSPSFSSLVYCEVKGGWRVRTNRFESVLEIQLELLLESVQIVGWHRKALSVNLAPVGADVGHQLPVSEEHHLGARHVQGVGPVSAI